MDITLARMTVLAFAVAGIIVWSVWIKFNLNRWRFAIAPLTYFFHVIIFNFAAQSGFFDPQFLNYWSTGVRLHSIVLLIGVGIIAIKWRRLWTTK